MSLVLPKHVAPTLVEATRALASDTQRGFVFVRPDASERFCSFSDVNAEAERRAKHFASWGLKKGDRLAMVIPDGDEFVLSFLGALFAGIVPVPIFPQLTFKNVSAYHETVSHIAKASDAAFLLTTTTTKPYVEPIVPSVPSLRGIKTVDALAEPMAGALDVRVEPTDTAFLQFTSGSTSRPKGVVVTHLNLAHNSEAFMIHGLRKDASFDKGVSWLPLFHDMGLIGFLIGPLFTNIPIVFMPTGNFVRSPRSWLEAIHRHRGTITYAPNFAYGLVAKRLREKDLEGLDLSCLRVAGCGAEPIQAKTLRDFAERCKPAGFDARAFLPSYGMAEATLALTFVPAFTGLRTDIVDSKALTLGKANTGASGDESATQELVNCGGVFPGHEIAIVDDQGNRLGDRQVGQIIAKGPSITSGYYQEPELTAAAFKDGWLHTGDLGYMVDGELYVCGRVKDIIIIRGRNFYPSDIEWVAGELPGVRRGNVVAFGTEVNGEEQLVICAEGMSSDVQMLEKSIAQAVNAYFSLSVHKVEIIAQGSLPRTSSGKPQRRKTKQLYLEGKLPKPRAAVSADATVSS